MCNKLQEIIPWQDEKAGYDEHRGFVTITSAAPKPLIRKHPRKRAIGGRTLPEGHGQDGALYPSSGLDGGDKMREMIARLGQDERGQDIAEYAVMLAVILVIVVGTIRLIGSNANNVFSSVASSVQ
jgi:Flp pilus assembly pilin Flp